MIQRLNPSALPEATGNYTHGTLVTGASRIVFVSGQVPWAETAGTADGKVPPDFATQCRLTWHNVLTVLAEAGMGAEHLVKVTAYLSDRRYREEFSQLRAEILGEHVPALTVIITDIYSEDWLLEIEAIAAA